MAVALTIPQSMFVSSFMQLERPDVPCAIVQPSCGVGTAVRLEFSVDGLTAASHAAYLLATADGTGNVFTAVSGSGPNVSAPFLPPTPWLRARTTVAMVGTTSLAAIPVATR